MNKTMRAELHLHTKLSDDISVLEVEEVFENARKYGVHTVAFTNLNNVQDFPAVLAAQEKHRNLKVIYGAELRYRRNGATFGLTALVRNQDGMKALYQIISSLQDGGVDPEVLKKHRKDLLIGSAGEEGELYHAISTGQDTEEIAAFYDYFELYPSESEEVREIYRKIFALGEELGVAVVAAGNCHYLKETDEICRRVMRTVDGYRDDNKKLFLHTTEEMLEEFSYLGTQASAAVIDAPRRIAALIEGVTPFKAEVHPLVIEGAYEQLRQLAYEKAMELYGEELPQPVRERLELELLHMKKWNFAPIYYIAYRMVRFMHEKGHYVGARGKIGSVLVAFLLGITEVNPLPPHYYCSGCHYTDFDVEKADGFDQPEKVCPRCGAVLKGDGHHLPMEFFMGYDGNKEPDIDLNFPLSKRQEELAFLQEMFGAQRVAHAGTIATLWTRYTEGYITVYEAKTADYFCEEERRYIAGKLCGVKRMEGCHPGGVFILPKRTEFEDYTPLRANKTRSPISKVTHMDFLPLRYAFLKMDILGYEVLDCLKALEERCGRSLHEVEWNDPALYDFFENANTLGIPEFDKDVMRDMLRLVKPNSFDDLVRISSLSHGTNSWVGNGEVLLRDGHSIRELPASCEDVFMQLEKYGVERETAFKIAEYVRRGRLGDDNEKTEKFMEILRKAQVPEWYIESLRKIRYLFPKAHSVAYVMNALRMAWFKKYHPEEFLEVYLETSSREI